MITPDEWFVENNRLRGVSTRTEQRSGADALHAACRGPLCLANDDDFPLDYFVGLHTARGIAAAESCTLFVTKAKG